MAPLLFLPDMYMDTVRVESNSSLCMTAQLDTQVSNVNMTQCVAGNPFQSFVYEPSSRSIKSFGLCLEQSDESANVRLSGCNLAKRNQQWVFAMSTGSMSVSTLKTLQNDGLCLDLSLAEGSDGNLCKPTCFFYLVCLTN